MIGSTSLEEKVAVVAILDKEEEIRGEVATTILIKIDARKDHHHDNHPGTVTTMTATANGTVEEEIASLEVMVMADETTTIEAEALGDEAGMIEEEEEEGEEEEEEALIDEIMIEVGVTGEEMVHATTIDVVDVRKTALPRLT